MHARYSDWLKALPDASRKIFEGRILASTWYPLRDAVSAPMKTMCDLLYGGNVNGAWQAGKFSAEHGLKGIYKLFVKLGTPNFIIGKGTAVFSTYYQPSTMAIVENVPGKCRVHITKFEEPDAYVEQRIGGWIERAIEISGAKSCRVNLAQSLAKGDPLTEFVVTWS